ncbi:MAG: chromate resistance protein ChrB domain-containing protein [Gammaproteobacteria bacterium]
MRAWRVLKASGAAVLRDGVYLLPDLETCRSILEGVSSDVLASGGTTHLVDAGGTVTLSFPELFDRAESYAELLAGIAECRHGLTQDTALDVLKQVRKLRKLFTALVEIDFFPGEPKRQTEAALLDLERAANRVLSPDEPLPAENPITPLSPAEYRSRLWATRQRPWVDRLASAWLIRRHIDPEARFIWLATPAELPGDALGFDFDGAAFSHVGNKVTFETLLASFSLERPALHRLAALVHYLDVGGVQPAEAVGVERVLAGLRGVITDDDRLLDAACGIFDGLLAAYDQKTDAGTTVSPQPSRE